MTNNKIRGLLLAALMVTSVFAGTIAFAGTAAAANADSVGADATLDSVGPYYQGQTLFLSGEGLQDSSQNSVSGTLTIRRITDSAAGEGDDTQFATTVNPKTADDGETYYEIDTADLQSDDYVIVDSDGDRVAIGTNENEFEITEQTLSAEFGDDSVKNKGSTTTSLDFSTNRGSTFDVVVTSENISTSDLADMFDSNSGITVSANEEDDEVTLSGVRKGSTDSLTVDFDGINSGTKTLDFEVADTTAEASASIDVTKGSDAATSFEDGSLTVNSGDSTDIQVNMQNTDSGFFQIGSNDAGYKALAYVEDGTDENGIVNVTVNTYNPNSPEYGLSVEDSDDGDITIVQNYNTETGAYNVDADGDADVDADDADFSDSDNVVSADNEGVDDLLDTGSYDFKTAVDLLDVEDSADDVGTLTVSDRATGSVQSWTTYPDAIDTGDVDADDVLSAVEDGDITQSSNIAAKDYAVIQVTETSGIYGYIQANSNNGNYEQAFTSEANALDGDDTNNGALNFTLTQVDPGQNQNAEVIYADSSALTFVPDDDTNNLFVVVQTDSALEGEWNATFTVEESSLADDTQTASTEFEVVERTASLDTNDDDVVEAAANENASITGETSIAPGSEITVTVQSESGADNPFVNRQTVNVSDDGTFSAEFDMADLEVGTNFTASVSASPSLDSDGDYEYEATIVESTDETTSTTDTSETTETTGTPETTGTSETSTTASDGGSGGSDDGGSGGDTTPTTTSTTSPGFGIAVALVALAGAALLAVRRE